MRQARALLAGGVWFLLAAGPALAQMALPAAKAPSGEDLFKRQCATCHGTSAADPPRQGPTLAGIFGRKVGAADGFRYSAGFAAADWAWDEAHLDPWLANPQAVIPGAAMPYRQSNPAVRAALIGYLKELQ
ncbi:c-type cytochrome [Azorhizobium doebereinerae]|uniref:c-type cytochrome n=1 Tax=Azorhizobium doebereinerae TaxID=281091 RepID=UPI000420E03B|nr:c-type cytochrome [Azorhizobium doebereinerae]